jgi:hypothetical protein
MKRITVEQSLEFIPIKEDFVGKGIESAEYFTFTPSTHPSYPSSEGWEDVNYFTNKLKNIKVSKHLADAQYIYILTNETMPGLCKIGFTMNKPQDRARQINAATGVAMDFNVEWFFPCVNAHALEKTIHAYLEQNGFRINKKKEFFNISVSEAISVVERLGEPYKIKQNETV